MLLASPKETLDLIFATQQFRQVALSPDGGQVAWVEARPNADRTPSSNSAIFFRAAAGGTPQRLTAGNGTALADEHGLAWSRNGRQLAFLSDREKPGQLQLYVVPANGGPARQLTHLTGYAAEPKWSPDGKTIALLNIPESTDRAGAVEAAARETGEIAETYTEQRLVLVDAASGATRTVSPVDTYVYEYDWSPNSRQFAVISAKGNGDNNWWIARLGVLDANGGTPREIFRPQTQIAVPRWSADGKASMCKSWKNCAGKGLSAPASTGKSTNWTNRPPWT